MAIDVSDFLQPGGSSDLFSLHGFMDETQQTAQDMLALAHAKSDTAMAAALDAIVALKTATMPAALAEPPLPPDVIVTVSGALGNPGFEIPPDFGSITQGTGTPATLDEVTIPDITGVPEYVRLVHGLNIPPAPEPFNQVAPVRPAVSFDFAIGADVPVAAYGDLPNLTGVTIPTFTPTVLALFNEPTPLFTGQVPDPFVDWTEPVHTSVFGTRISDTLTTMMDGGTGLTAAVEAALWERARSREDQVALKAVRESTNEWAARGFTMPTGELRAAVIAIYDENNKKVSSLGRDIGIAQADLEQKNRQFAVEKGIGYEGLMVNIFLAVTDRSFQLAKFAVESHIQIFNAQIAAFNVEQAIYGQKIELYKAQLQYALARIEEFKGLIEAQKLIAEVDNTLIAGFVAKINAFKTQVEAYTALVQAAVARAGIERGKIDLYKADIDGYIGLISAKKSEFDGYASRVQGEVARGDLEKTNAAVFTAEVDAFSKTNEVYFKRAEALIENNKARVQYTIADLDRLRTASQQQLAAIQAGATMFEAVTRRATAEASLGVEIERLKQSTVVEANRNVIARYAAQTGLYATRTQQVIELAKINAASLQAIGQIASNMVAGAMAGTSVGAQIAAQGSASESKSEADQKSISASESSTISNNYSVNHNFSHEE